MFDEDGLEARRLILSYRVGGVSRYALRVPLRLTHSALHQLANRRYEHPGRD